MVFLSHQDVKHVDLEGNIGVSISRGNLIIADLMSIGTSYWTYDSIYLEAIRVLRSI
jgi:hypothetical protein